jgi:polyisoprenoid-binding protein YceI
MFRVMLCLAATLLLVQPAFAQTARKWEMIPEESAIVFHGKQMGADFEGRFKNFSAEIYFDPAALAESRVTAIIDTASADSGDAERDENLKGPEWLAVETFPAARFESAEFTRTGENAFEARGTLTIHNVTLPVVLPFTLEFLRDDSGKEKALMKGSLVLDRSNFGLGTGDWADPSIIANEVPVDVVVSATAVQ